MKKTLLTTLVAIYLIFAPFVLAQKFEDLDPATQAEVQLQAEQQGISVEEFINTNFGEAKAAPNETVYFLVAIYAVVILGAIVLVVFFVRRAATKTSREIKEAAKYDAIRKENLVALYKKIKQYYLENNQLPTDSQFNTFRNELQENLAKDPLWKSQLPGHPNIIVDYNYTQIPPSSVKTDPHYFKLWSSLINTMQVGVDTNRMKELFEKEGLDINL